MNPTEIIWATKRAGLRLEIDPENRLIVDGKRSIQERFLPILKQQKTGILEALKAGGFDLQNTPKNKPTIRPKERKNPPFLIPFDAPYLVMHYDQSLGFTQTTPYIQTPAFQSEITQARAFLKNLYLRGVDIEITPENDLQFIPMPNQPMREDLKEAARLQHSIREQLNKPVNLYIQE